MGDETQGSDLARRDKHLEALTRIPTEGQHIFAGDRELLCRQFNAVAQAKLRFRGVRWPKQIEGRTSVARGIERERLAGAKSRWQALQLLCKACRQGDRDQ